MSSGLRKSPTAPDVGSVKSARHIHRAQICFLFFLFLWLKVEAKNRRHTGEVEIKECLHVDVCQDNKMNVL